MATPDRWPPWIEAAVNLTADATINSAVAAAIPNLANVTFTPHVATRILVGFNFDVILTAVPGSILFLEAVLTSGVVVTRKIGVNPAALNGRDTGFHNFMFDVLKETTYTLSWNAYLDVAGSTFVVKGNAAGNFRGTGYSIVAMPNLHS